MGILIDINRNVGAFGLVFPKIVKTNRRTGKDWHRKCAEKEKLFLFRKKVKNPTFFVYKERVL